MTKNEIEINEILKNDYIAPVSNFDGKYTKTSMFLLNTLSINLYNPLIKKFLVNAYLGDEKYDHRLKCPIFCLFKTKDLKDPEWKKLYKICLNKVEFITDYDCGLQDGNNLVMIVFECPKENIQDYYHFKRGRYSKFSDEYKSKFTATIKNDTGNEVKSVIYGVIHKEQYMKDKVKIIFGIDDETVSEMKELWDIPRKEREYYRYSKENS